MCGGPSYEEKVARAEAAAAQQRAAEAQREQAELAKRQEIEQRAEAKREGNRGQGD